MMKIYYREVSGKKIHRNWLSFYVNNGILKSMYCSVCIAFGTKTNNFSSESGCTNFRHIYSVITSHEESSIHSTSVEIFFRASKEMSLEYLINRDMTNLRNEVVEKNIHVLKVVFDIVKFLGQQNLSYRGSAQGETLANIDDLSLNSGNFLEMVRLIAKRDVILNDHLTRSIKKSKQRIDKLKANNKESSKGRGSLVTFLSKTTVDKIIVAILISIRNKIKNEIGEQIFSIQMDSTQDIGVHDQASICIRYLYNGEIKERLFAVVNVINSSGKALFELLKDCFNQHGLHLDKVVGESFDGASNMSGSFSGLQSLIKSINNKSVYIWCYSHVLNLCICDTVSNLDAKNLFGLLNRLSTFFSSSYKRMNVWINENKLNNSIGSEKLKKLQKISESNTRWWSRKKTLDWVFDGDGALFPVVLSALNHITTDSSFDAKCLSEARSLIGNLCEFKTIITAHLFLHIFKVIGPTSDYLQSNNIDILSAWTMVENAKKQINKISFDTIFSDSQGFTEKMNIKCYDLDLPDHIVVENVFPQQRVRHRKQQFDEQSEPQVLMQGLDKFKVDTFRCVIDQISVSLNERFSQNASLIADVQYLHPSYFINIKNTMPPNALKLIGNLINVDFKVLQNELLSFSRIFPNIIGSISQRTSNLIDSTKSKVIETDIEEENDYINDFNSNSADSNELLYDEDEKHLNIKAKHTVEECNQCLICCYKMLYKYNMHSIAYTNIYLAYEYASTLSFTQVNCERAFSKLKLIKTRLRATLEQEKLEAFMMMSVEKELLHEVKFEEILTYIKNSSSLMNKMLT